MPDVVDGYYLPDSRVVGLDRYIDNPPLAATVPRNGVTPLQRVKNLRDRRAQQINEQKLDRASAIMDWGEEACTGIDSSLNDISKEALRLRKALKNGTMSAAEVKRAIPSLMQQTGAFHTTLDEVDTRCAAADELADLDPAEYEQQLLDRFPSLRRKLPQVSEDYLLGIDRTDPLGEE